MKGCKENLYRARRPARKPATWPPNSGQALVELALVVPLLLTLALGVIEIGRYAYIAILVGNAARAGAAYGAQGRTFSSDTGGIIAAALADFAGGGSSSNTSNGLGGDTLTVTSAPGSTPPSPTCGCDSGGTITPAGPAGNGTNAQCFVTNASLCTGGGHWAVTVSVTASGKFNGLFSYPGIPSSITVTRTSSMRVALN
jgi:Flp pilus assembly protein TadG